MRKNKILLITVFINITISIFFIIYSGIWKNEKKVIRDDVVGYYAYLPAIFIYKDLKLDFTTNYKGQHKFIIWSNNLKNGNKVLKYSMGMSMLYAPFFFFGHIAANIFHFDTGGYSLPYSISLILAALFYFVIGMIFQIKILSKFFSDKITSITILAIGLGTNLLFYSSIRGAISHTFNFTLFSIFIYLTLLWHEKSTFKNSLFLGLIFGLISLTRPSNSIIAIFFIFWNVINFKDFKLKINLFFSKFPQILTIVLSAFLIWIPQIIYWKINTGHFFWYSYVGESFFFNKPQITNTLFSYRNGLFIYTPLIFLILFGFYFVLKNNKIRSFFVPTLIFIILNCYIISSWWCWWYVGFGLRAYIDSYALLTIPLAAMLNFFLNKKIIHKFVLLSIIFILVVHQLFQTIQYQNGAIHYDAMTKAAYWDSFLRLYPSNNFYKLIDKPDYQKASIGINSTDKESFKEITNSQQIICDVEHTDKRKTTLLSNDGNIIIQGINAISNLKSFSGNYSLKLDKQNPLGFTIVIPTIKFGEKYEIKVKKMSEYNNGVIIIQGVTKHFYVSIDSTSKIENSKWSELCYQLVVPEYLNNCKIKIYCYNPDIEPTYFDDFEIKKTIIAN